jgi:hypothetical protein
MLAASEDDRELVAELIEDGQDPINFWLMPFTAETWIRTLYGILSLPIAVVWFVLTIPGVLISSVLTVVFLLGTLLSFIFFGIARGGAQFERARARIFLGIHTKEPSRRQPLKKGILASFRARFVDAQTWREITYFVLNLPLGFVSSFLSLYFWVQTIYCLFLYPVFYADTITSNDWGGPTSIGIWSVHILPGFVTLFLGPWVIKGVTWVQGRLVQSLLGGK